MFDKLLKFTGVLVALAAVGLVIYFVFLSNSSVKGTVHVSSSSSVTNQHLPEKATLTGTSIYLEYPGSYVHANLQHTDRNAKEQYLFNSSAFSNKQMAVTVRDLPSNSLEDSSDYKYRLVTTDQYKSRSTKAGGGPATVMYRIDGFEQTAFIPHGGKLAVIAITFTGQQSVDLTSEMDDILKSFRWNQ